MKSSKLLIQPEITRIVITQLFYPHTLSPSPGPGLYINDSHTPVMSPFHLLSEALRELAGEDHNAGTAARPGQLDNTPSRRYAMSGGTRQSGPRWTQYQVRLMGGEGGGGAEMHFLFSYEQRERSSNEKPPCCTSN